MTDNVPSSVSNYHRSIANSQNFGETLKDSGKLMDGREGLGGQTDASDLAPASYDERFFTPGENQIRSFPEIGQDNAPKFFPF